MTLLDASDQPCGIKTTTVMDVLTVLDTAVLPLCMQFYIYLTVQNHHQEKLLASR